MNDYRLDRVYRILDANSNRAAEGLRTVEEYFRFIKEDSTISTDLKQLRHDLMSAVGRLDRVELLTHRDVAGDIGSTIKTDSEQVREDLRAIMAAASQRVQQSVRCLEEYTKLIDPSIAKEFEQLRYRAYSIMSVVELRFTADSLWLEQARLYVLIDCQLPLNVFLDRCIALSQAGADVLQIRDKQSDAKMLMEYARSLCERIDKKRTRVIVNDRVDLASTLGIGVHLGQSDIPIAAARSLLSGRHCIGISTHSIDQAMEAERVGADYIGCGPTFPSRTKDFSQFSGLDFLRQVAAKTSIPSFAIGGITLELLDRVLETGIQRIAVSHSIWQANDPAKAAQAFAERLASK